MLQAVTINIFKQTIHNSICSLIILNGMYPFPLQHVQDDKMYEIHNIIE
jgi:hypothetical protein